MATKVKLISESISPTLAGGTLTGNLSFGDDDKAIFGADSDLQIYHDGSNSYITDSGTGNLYIDADTQLIIRDQSSGEKRIETYSSGQVALYYSGGNKKFHTTSTGATVTGNLAVTGDLDITGNVNSASVTDLDVTDQTITLGAGQTEALSGGSGIIVDGSNASLLWDETNDTWDFNKTLHLTTATTNHALIIEENSGGEQYQIGVDSYGGLVFYNSTTKVVEFTDSSEMQLYDGGSVTTKISPSSDSYFTGGNVGIGTSSPAQKLHLSVGGGTSVRMRLSAGSYGNANIGMDETGLNIATDGAQANAYGNINLVPSGSGFVGIGTTSPQSLLHLSSTAPIISLTDTNSFTDANDRLIFRAGTDEGLIQWYDDSGSSTTTIATFESSGKVGIGTTNPEYELEIVDATGDANLSIKTTSTNNSARLRLTANGTGNSVIMFADENDTNVGLISYDHSDDSMNFNVADQNKMSIDSSGRVLIGTDSGDGFNSNASLRVQSSSHDYLAIKTGTTSQGGILIGDTDDDFAGGMIYSNSNDDLWLYAGNAKRMTIEGDTGDVGIGTDSPAFASGSGLEIERAGIATLRLQNTSSGKSVEITQDSDFKIEAMNSAADIILKPTANVGIGTTDPSYQVHIQKTGSAEIELEGTVSAELNLHDSGGTANQRRGRLTQNGAGFKLQALNDADDTVTHEFITMDCTNGNVGIAQTSPLCTLEVKGAITHTNGDADMGTHTHSAYASLVNSGEINFTIGYSGTLTNGRVHTFTYEATSWKAWGCEIEMASTEGLATWRIGGYNNNSTGNNIYEENDTNGMGTMTYSRSGQHNIITITQNRTHIHPCFRVRYFQSGGDGAPRMDRAKWVIS